jgi:hypothetical protein
MMHTTNETHWPRSCDIELAKQRIAVSDIIYVIDADRTSINILPTTAGYVAEDFFVDNASPRLSGIASILSDKRIITWGLGPLTRLAAVGYEPRAPIRDLRLLSQLLWPDSNKDLSPEVVLKQLQVPYWQSSSAAARLLALLPAIDDLVYRNNLVHVATIEERCLPGILIMGAQGLPVDVPELHHQVVRSVGDMQRLLAELDRHVTSDHSDRPKWRTDQEAQKTFQQMGLYLPDLKEESLIRNGHPAAIAYRNYRHARNQLARRRKWHDLVDDDRRVRPRWDQLGTKTGRITVSDPSVHQLARGAERRIIRAPSGWILVAADYNQAQMRIVARMTNDPTLAQALHEGRDLHAETARSALHVITPSAEQREWGKRFNFALLYGGRNAAQSLLPPGACWAGSSPIDQFFARCPGVKAWHDAQNIDLNSELRTPAGRRLWAGGLLSAADRLCYLAQGIEADAIKTALALLWERRSECPGAFPILVAHDEIVLEAPVELATRAATWLSQCMVSAMAPYLNPLPVGPIVPRIVRTWGD